MEQMKRFTDTTPRMKSESELTMAERYNNHIRFLHRELYHVWDFIGEEGLWSEAREYVADRCLDRIPYEW